MWFLKIEKIIYSWEKYSYESSTLKNGLNIIEWPNWTWKSTFSDLIYFWLWCEVKHFSSSSKKKHKEITEDSHNYVELHIEIDNLKYKLRRNFDDKSRWNIIISSFNGEINVFSIYRSKSEKYTFSDWILDKLWIEVVEISQWKSKWKMGFQDLSRLLYNDQKTSPEKIYKEAIYEWNFISDSKHVRKTIFEVLIWTDNKQYHKIDSELKDKENEKIISKNLLDEMIKLSDEIISDDWENLNLIHLLSNKKKLEDDISSLEQQRLVFQNWLKKASTFVDTSSIKNKLYDSENKLIEYENRKKILLQEVSNITLLKENIILETTQINKIIFTNKKLQLFSPNTCPYCLDVVKREPHLCICWNEIIEWEYEKFFYDECEYVDLLKAKKKSIQTINLTLDSYDNELKEINEKIHFYNVKIVSLKEEMHKIVVYADSPQSNEIKLIENEILEKKSELITIKQKIYFEEKIEEYQEKYSLIEWKYKDLLKESTTLKNKIDKSNEEKINSFNKIYNLLMKNALKNCRSAKIDSNDYMPEINNWEYKEHSSVVPIRLLYYFSLLYISLEYSDVKYPKFILIDTPETAWIDENNLISAIWQIINSIPIPKVISVDSFNKFDENWKRIILKNYLLNENIYELNSDWDDKELIDFLFNNTNFQIILSTWLGKYPEIFSKYVFQTLNENNKLLWKSV